ncbi:hypothetical protein cypCar_00025253 [Cyprinus carpio]|nr:hypothetical protein cypCar_00025253 [Cyprinus carpio]
MHRIQGQNRLAGPAQGDHGFQGPSREPFKIREQIKLEELDSDEDEEKQPPQPPSLAMASNSIFENFPSYQSCFSRGYVQKPSATLNCKYPQPVALISRVGEAAFNLVKLQAARN